MSNVMQRIFGTLPSGNKGKLTEKFQRPHFYPLTVNTGAPICLSPQGRQSVRLFAIQANLNNGGIVTLGDSMVAPNNGFQFDAGRARQFSVGRDDLLGGDISTPISWQDAVSAARQNAIGLQSAEKELTVFLDLSDWWVTADTNGQLISVFWTTIIQ